MKTRLIFNDEKNISRSWIIGTISELEEQGFRFVSSGMRNRNDFFMVFEPINQIVDDEGYFYCPRHTWSLTSEEITEDTKCPDCKTDLEFIEWQRKDPIGQWRKVAKNI